MRVESVGFRSRAGVTLAFARRSAERAAIFSPPPSPPAALLQTPTDHDPRPTPAAPSPTPPAAPAVLKWQTTRRVCGSCICPSGLLNRPHDTPCFQTATSIQAATLKPLTKTTARRPSETKHSAPPAPHNIKDALHANPSSRERGRPTSWSLPPSFDFALEVCEDDQIEAKDIYDEYLASVIITTQLYHISHCIAAPGTKVESMDHPSICDKCTPGLDLIHLGGIAAGKEGDERGAAAQTRPGEREAGTVCRRDMPRRFLAGDSRA